MNAKAFLVASTILALPTAAHAQSSWFAPTGPTYPGVYIGAEGAANWLLNNNSYVMDTGWAAGGKVGYDFIGPRVEVEGLYHSNTGTAVVAFPTGYANVRGKIDQVSVMANVLYDFFPGATITPYIGAGAGVAFVDANIQGCNVCLTMFAYQGIVGLGFNATPALRIGLEGRYYGTTNPGAYVTGNRTLCVRCRTYNEMGSRLAVLEGMPRHAGHGLLAYKEGPPGAGATHGTGNLAKGRLRRLRVYGWNAIGAKKLRAWLACVLRSSFEGAAFIREADPLRPSPVSHPFWLAKWLHPPSRS
jgi:opacity protein-like surface antigen